jgi:peptide/nickel transport system permease protein
VRQIGFKLARLVLVLFFVTFFSFYLVNLLPGDPATNFKGIGADKAKLEQIRHDLGLDKPVIVRYGQWLGGFLTGDLGKYYGIAGQTPAEKAKSDFPVTIQLMAYTMIVSLAIAIPLGMFAGYRPNTLFDHGSSAVVFFLASVPSFAAAFLLKQYLAIKWNLLPESGWGQPWDVGIVQHLKYAVMPVTCLAITQIAIFQRLLRSDMIATLQEDYITMAKSKGMRPRRILLRHALRPSSLTLLTVAGLSIGTLIGGSVIIEQIFSIPGIGTDTVEALLAREYVALQSFIAIIGIFYVLVNFAVDFLYTVLDPRIRYG